MDREPFLIESADSGVPPSAARRSAEKQLVDKVCTWIDLHLAEDIGWDRLVRISGVPASRLQQMFQRCAKTTPMMYIRARRLEQRLGEAGRPPRRAAGG